MACQFGTHVWQGETFSTSDIKDQTRDLIAEAAEGDDWIMHKVEFFGGSKSALEKEIEALLQAAKNLT